MILPPEVIGGLVEKGKEIPLKRWGISMVGHGRGIDFIVVVRSDMDKSDILAAMRAAGWIFTGEMEIP